MTDLTPAPYAYPGGEDQKRWIVAEADMHREMDDYRQGAWSINGEGRFRGCFLGFTAQSLGLVSVSGIGGVAHHLFGGVDAIAHLAERCFEGLPEADAPALGPAIFRAIPACADLRPPVDQMMLWVLVDPAFGARRRATGAAATMVDWVAALYRRRIAGDNPPTGVWRNTARVAGAAGADAADAAAAAAAYPAAVYAAAYATRAARLAATASCRHAFWRAFRDEFLVQLAAAPIHPEAPQARADQHPVSVEATND